MSDKAKGEFFLLNATSADIDRDGKTYVVLYWTPRYDVSGYNLYRSKSGSISSRAKPINGRQPIAPVRTCKALKKFIHPRSREWQQLVNAFTSLQNSKEIEMVADSFNRARFKDSSLLSKLQKAPRLPQEFIPISPKGVPWEVNPCEAIDRGLTAEEDEMFEALAANSLNFRLARGLAYRDYKVEANEKYFYELRGVLANGREIMLGKGLTVQAGRFVLPEAPSGLNLTGGDSKILALWNRNPSAFSYRVCRSVHPVFGHQVIHEEQIQLDITHNLEGEELLDPRPGFLDYQRWDENGLPEDHDVNGLSISGPKNGYKYYYKVAGVDILERQGLWCGNKSATPISITPPKAPETLRVDPSTAPLGLMLSWPKVTHNADNHQILESSQTYEIYRSETLEELEDLDDLALRLVGTVSANPTDPTVSTVSWMDSDPVLSPPYGEKDFWYRIRCLDINLNMSFPSAVIGGRLPDTTAPGPTKLVDSKGFSDHIRISWIPNPEPDLIGYQIYRAICDHGKLYHPKDDEKQEPGCDIVLVGTVSIIEAKECLETEGTIYFDDYSVPPDSPLCYAYWVRAYDAAQNLYMGDHGCPKPDEYICQRLLEETAPPAPVITTLKARNKAVLIEWIASPIQDLRAFHVYRSKAEDDPGIFIGCVLSDGSSYPGRWEGIQPTCSDIPAEPNPVAVHGKFLDKSPDPKCIYWYRVSALDWLGNESEKKDLSYLPAISTFTFLSDLPVSPSVLPQTTPSAAGCGLKVLWSPTYTPANLRGFVVFRSGGLLGAYRQVSPIIAGNAFTDPSARRGVDYWYQIQAIDWAGKLSSPSAPLQHSY